MSGPTNFVFSANSQYLFNRAYVLTMGAPGSTSALQYGTVGANPSPLRIRFDIDKTMVGSPNKSKIEIYNLSAQTRQSIKKGYLVQLQAGYATNKNSSTNNNLMQTLFIGSVILATSTRVDADIITALECGDGESAITNARLDKSYPSGTTLAAILQDVGVALATVTGSQPQGIAAGVALGIPPQTFNNGFVARGACRDTLDILCKSQNLEWNIQNGNLNIIPITNFNGQSAIVVSSSTGMIGVPSENINFIQFNNLLNPNLVPGSLIQLVSQNVTLNGFYKIRRSHFEGDTYDQKWQTAVEATQVQNVQQTLPIAQGFNYTPAVTNV
jgi:hypothetical protein